MSIKVGDVEFAEVYLGSNLLDSVYLGNILLWEATTPPVQTYSVGGTVSGLVGSVKLVNNGADEITVSANGGFTFPSKSQTGATYNVTVSEHPPGQSTVVNNGTGTIASADITNVGVVCSTVPTYSIGGSVSGLNADGLQLQLNGGNTTSIASGATSYVFTNELIQGDAYEVTILTEPTEGTTQLSNASGTVGTSDVTNANVTYTSTFDPNDLFVSGNIGGWYDMTLVSTLNATLTPPVNNGDVIQSIFNGRYAPAATTRLALTGSGDLPLYNTAGYLYGALPADPVVQDFPLEGLLTTDADTTNQYTIICGFVQSSPADYTGLPQRLFGMREDTAGTKVHQISATPVYGGSSDVRGAASNITNGTGWTPSNIFPIPANTLTFLTVTKDGTGGDQNYRTFLNKNFGGASTANGGTIFGGARSLYASMGSFATGTRWYCALVIDRILTDQEISDYIDYYTP